MLEEIDQSDFCTDEYGNSYVHTKRGLKYLAGYMQHIGCKTSQLFCSGVQLDELDIIMLSHGIRENNSITSLDLFSVGLSHIGAKYLCDALKVNSSIQKITLNCNSLGALGAKYLSEVLIVNKSITSIYLRNNNIGDDGLEHLMKALQLNYTLTFINLEKNNIRDAGAQKILDMLKQNQTILDVCLKINKIDDDYTFYIETELDKRKLALFDTVEGVAKCNKVECSLHPIMYQQLKSNGKEYYNKVESKKKMSYVAFEAKWQMKFEIKYIRSVLGVAKQFLSTTTSIDSFVSSVANTYVFFPMELVTRIVSYISLQDKIDSLVRIDKESEVKAIC